MIATLSRRPSSLSCRVMEAGAFVCACGRANARLAGPPRNGPQQLRHLQAGQAGRAGRGQAGQAAQAWSAQGLALTHPVDLVVAAAVCVAGVEKLGWPVVCVCNFQPLLVGVELWQQVLARGVPAVAKVEASLCGQYHHVPAVHCSGQAGRQAGRQEGCSEGRARA